MEKVKISVEIDLGNAAMQTPHEALEEVIASLTGLCQRPHIEGTYQESIIDECGNTVGNFIMEVK